MKKVRARIHDRKKHGEVEKAFWASRPGIAELLEFHSPAEVMERLDRFFELKPSAEELHRIYEKVGDRRYFVKLAFSRVDSPETLFRFLEGLKYGARDLAEDVRAGIAGRKSAFAEPERLLFEENLKNRRGGIWQSCKAFFRRLFGR